jgi:DNA modification methylase
MNKIEFGDCRETMRRWAADGVKVQMCVTSPPYFGLRDYGHEGQIGLEQTPEEYIAAMVEVFRCVKDVLADDGTLWLNIGDSYAGSGGAGGQYKPGGIAKTGTSAPSTWSAEYSKKPVNLNVPGCKPKDLIGIPWMLAFALRADGWYLRQDIIWHKPNPMPESVRDRCTKAHEYVFLLSKSERYFFDSDAMQEPASDNPVSASRRNRADFSTVGTKAIQGTGFGQSGQGENAKYKGETRNRRSVWTVATKPYKGAHFATFPTALIEPCILAGSRPGDTVLDPFMGSGTTAAVSLQHGRQYLGCELNPDYGPLQQERISAEMNLFNQPTQNPIESESVIKILPDIC